MKIYTKTGDKGETSLVGGTRVPKTDDRIQAYGTVDELNAWMGVLRDTPDMKTYSQDIIRIQENLFTIGSNLALEEPGKFEIPQLGEEDIEALEKGIDAMDSELPPMRNFVLPGGHMAVSHCHVARTVCRRAERKTISLSDKVAVDERIIRFLNRLSDFLFVLSRKVAADTNAPQQPWLPRK